MFINIMAESINVTSSDIDNKKFIIDSSYGLWIGYITTFKMYGKSCDFGIRYINIDTDMNMEMMVIDDTLLKVTAFTVEFDCINKSISPNAIEEIIPMMGNHIIGLDLIFDDYTSICISVCEKETPSVYGEIIDLLLNEMARHQLPVSSYHIVCRPTAWDHENLIAGG